MTNYIDMYARILDRLILDVIEHACKITPTVMDIWARIPICDLTLYNELLIFTNIITIQPTRLDERVAITVTTDIGTSSTNTYLWEEDEIEPLIYAFLSEREDEFYNNEVMIYEMRDSVGNLTTALSKEICTIIDKYIMRPNTGEI